MNPCACGDEDDSSFDEFAMLERAYHDIEHADPNNVWDDSAELAEFERLEALCNCDSSASPQYPLPSAHGSDEWDDPAQMAAMYHSPPPLSPQGSPFGHLQCRSMISATSPALASAGSSPQYSLPSAHEGDHVWDDAELSYHSPPPLSPQPGPSHHRHHHHHHHHQHHSHQDDDSPQWPPPHHPDLDDPELEMFERLEAICNCPTPANSPQPQTRPSRSRIPRPSSGGAPPARMVPPAPAQAAASSTSVHQSRSRTRSRLPCRCGPPPAPPAARQPRHQPPQRQPAAARRVPSTSRMRTASQTRGGPPVPCRRTPSAGRMPPPGRVPSESRVRSGGRIPQQPPARRAPPAGPVTTPCARRVPSATRARTPARQPPERAPQAPRGARRAPVPAQQPQAAPPRRQQPHQGPQLYMPQSFPMTQEQWPVLPRGGDFHRSVRHHPHDESFFHPDRPACRCKKLVTGKTAINVTRLQRHWAPPLAAQHIAETRVPTRTGPRPQVPNIPTMPPRPSSASRPRNMAEYYPSRPTSRTSIPTPVMGRQQVRCVRPASASPSAGHLLQMERQGHVQRLGVQVAPHPEQYGHVPPLNLDIRPAADQAGPSHHHDASYEYLYGRAAGARQDSSHARRQMEAWSMQMDPRARAGPSGARQRLNYPCNTCTDAVASGAIGGAPPTPSSGYPNVSTLSHLQDSSSSGSDPSWPSQPCPRM